MTDKYLCPICGHAMKFPHKGIPYCENCRLVMSAEEHERILMNDKQSEMSSTNEEPDTGKEEYQAVCRDHAGPKPFSPKNYGIEVCSKCGAGLSPGTRRITDRCPFCNNIIGLVTKIMKSQAADFIIPFEKNTSFFRSSLKESVRNSLLLPDVFRKAVNSGDFKIKAVYVPLWLFNIRTEGSLSYDVAKISMENKGKGTEYKHTIRNVSKTGTEVIRNLPQNATSRIDERIVNALAPYEADFYESLKPKDLSGIHEQIYDFDDGSFSTVILGKAKKSWENSLIRTKYYDYHHIYRKEIRHTPEHIHSTLFPIFLTEININGETLLYAMNGQSGKTYAEFPISYNRRIACILSSCIFLTSLLCGIFTKIFMFASSGHYYHHKNGTILLCIYFCSWVCGLFMEKILKFFSKSNISSLSVVLAMSAASVLLTAITIYIYLKNTKELVDLIFLIFGFIITFSTMLYSSFKTVNKAVKDANKKNEEADTVPESCISKTEKREEKTQKDFFYDRIKDSAKPVVPDSVITNPQYSPERRKENNMAIIFTAITIVVMIVISFLLWLFWNSLRLR